MRVVKVSEDWMRKVADVMGDDRFLMSWEIELKARRKEE